MGRPIYSHELNDPDFSWLISNFQENHPHYSAIDISSLPVVFIRTEAKDFAMLPVPVQAAVDPSTDDLGDEDGV